MDGLTDSELILGFSTMEAAGRQYKVRALPLSAVLSGEFKESGLIIPRDSESPGRFQLLNLEDEERRKALDKWLCELVECGGAPVSLEIVAQHGWTIVDIGRFLDRVVQISG